MTLREMVEALRIAPLRVEIRDAENYEIMTCNTDSKGLEMYLDMTVKEWFPSTSPPSLPRCDFVVSVDFAEGDEK